MSKRKRITRQQLETTVELLEQQRAAGEWHPAQGQCDETFKIFGGDYVC
jgi:hypothetical protein